MNELFCTWFIRLCLRHIQCSLYKIWNHVITFDPSDKVVSRSWAVQSEHNVTACDSGSRRRGDTIERNSFLALFLWQRRLREKDSRPDGLFVTPRVWVSSRAGRRPVFGRAERENARKGAAAAAAGRRLKIQDAYNTERRDPPEGRQQVQSADPQSERNKAHVSYIIIIIIINTIIYRQRQNLILIGNWLVSSTQ